MAALRGEEILPWSGDLDICMTSEEMERFIDKGVPELPTSMFFQSRETDPWVTEPGLYKLRDRYSNYSEYAGWFPEQKQHNGLQLDFFICSQNKCHWEPLGVWKSESTFPLTKTRFLQTDYYLSRDIHEQCRILYGDDYMTTTRTNHVGAWHTTEPCAHPASLEWPA
ncbi:MAG: LicD family protein [Pseudomonadota bacterium]